jgi:competence protein ComGF
MMVMQVLAGVVVLLCVAMLARLLLRTDQQRRLDRTIQSKWQSFLHGVMSVWRGVKHWRMRRQAKQAAAIQAQEIINRMRIRSVEREGNVYKPEAFKRRPEDHRKH